MGDWALIYATDASGNKVSGSLGALRVAVMHAADVKVMYLTGNRWWSRQCLSATVPTNDDNYVVSATCTEAVNTNSGANGLEVAVPLQLEQQVYNSSGWRSRATGGKLDQPDRVPMRWYVRDYHVDWFLNPDLTRWMRDPNP